MPARAACGTSQLGDSASAARAAAMQAAEALDGAHADLALVFLSADHAARAEEVSATVHRVLTPAVLAGTTTLGAIGGDRELEDSPGLSVLAAALPGAAVSAYPVASATGPEGAVLNVPAGFTPPAPGDGAALLLADPYSFPVEGFLDLLSDEWGGAMAVGGLASGGGEPGEHALLCGDTVMRRGAVVVTLAGSVELHAVVSQGCAPIGPEMVVTAADGQVIAELAGKPAYERLVEVVEALDENERALAQEGIMVGLVIDENRAEYSRGDYLIRSMMGADPNSGALVVGAAARVGQTLRFQVRDARIADRDLRDALRAEAQVVPGRIVGGVLFACTGRGSAMFSAPDHDARALHQELGVPAAGMFCAGEIGPVGGVTFVHGFTATMALLVERDEPRGAWG